MALFVLCETVLFLKISGFFKSCEIFGMPFMRVLQISTLRIL